MFRGSVLTPSHHLLPRLDLILPVALLLICKHLFFVPLSLPSPHDLQRPEAHCALSSAALEGSLPVPTRPQRHVVGICAGGSEPTRLRALPDATSSHGATYRSHPGRGRGSIHPCLLVRCETVCGLLGIPDFHMTLSHAPPMPLSAARVLRSLTPYMQCPRN